MTRPRASRPTARSNSAAQTRARLIEHGRAAFAAKGHDNVSLQRDVLEPAGVSTGSFYHQFRDKTDLLVAVLEDGRQHRRNAVEHALDESTEAPGVERATRRLALWLELLESDEDMLRIQRRELDNEDERVRTLLADFRTGTFAPLTNRLSEAMASRSDGFDTERATTFIRELVHAVALDYVDLPPEKRAAQRDGLAQDLAAFIIGGITGMASVSKPSGVAAP